MYNRKFSLISRARKVQNIAPKNWGHQRGYGVEVIAPAARKSFFDKIIVSLFQGIMPARSNVRFK